MSRLFVFTYLPSPYQVELFDALAAAGTDLFVLYACRRHDTPVAREWSVPPLAHPHAFADSPGFQISSVVVQLAQSDLYIMNYYRHPVARPLLRERLRVGKAWCFWGERPGVRFRGLVGKLYRALTLWPLYRSRSPIWGVGSWAVQAWKRDFGKRREYHNIPYFSDLRRFATQREYHPGKPLCALFSGSLIERKGVDLLANAFAVLLCENRNLKLIFAGVGPLEGALRQILSQSLAQVEFLGFVPWEKLPEAYAQADLLCVPSRYDGWAMVVPEGLAAGLPVLTTDQTGAAHDLIRSNENGWITPAGDGEALLREWREIIQLPPAKCAEMSQAAVKSVARHQLSDGVTRFLEAAEASMAE